MDTIDFGEIALTILGLGLGTLSIFIAIMGIYDAFYETSGEKDLNYFCIHNGYDKGELSAWHTSYCLKERNNTVYKKEIGKIILDEEDPLKRYKFVEYYNG